MKGLEIIIVGSFLARTRYDYYYVCTLVVGVLLWHSRNNFRSCSLGQEAWLLADMSINLENN